MLPALPLILPSKGYSIRNYLDRVLNEHQLVAVSLMEINGIHTLLKLVDLGGRVTVLMSSTIVDQPQLRAVKLTGADMTRRATITWPKDEYRKKAATLLVGFLLLHAAAYGDKKDHQLNEALNSKGETLVLLLKSLLNDCGCSKPRP